MKQKTEKCSKGKRRPMRGGQGAEPTEPTQVTQATQATTEPAAAAEAADVAPIEISQQQQVAQAMTTLFTKSDEELMQSDLLWIKQIVVTLLQRVPVESVEPPTQTGGKKKHCARSARSVRVQRK